MLSRRFVVVSIVALLTIAQPSQADEDGHKASRALAVAGSLAANVIPGWSAFVSPRCLPGYILCKLSFAGMGTVASGVQLVAGGDVSGAKRTLERAFGGDWLVTPSHVTEDRTPDPYPELERDLGDGEELPDF